MLRTIAMIVILAAGFSSIALSLVTEEKLRLRLIGIAAAIAFTIGIFFYGYGYAFCCGISVVSVLRALLALCRMLGGGNDLAVIQSAPLLQNPIAITIFWFGHFCAYYVTAGAVMYRFGEQMLRSIRVRLLRHGPLLLIYGANRDSITYGKRMREKKYSVLFADGNCSATDEKTIFSNGAVLERNIGSDHPNSSFLFRLGLKSGDRELLAVALNRDVRRNLTWARSLRDALEKASISPKRTTLLISAAEEEVSELQEKDDVGFGTVYAFDRYELVARMMVKAAPPWEMLPFDGEGLAARDFHCVLIGFGRMGRAMLSHILMNAQYAGSSFAADVFDPDAETGIFSDEGILDDYAVTFHEKSGKSKAFYTFLREHNDEISYIAICTGNPVENEEIAEELLNWYRGADTVPTLLLASTERAMIFQSDGEVHEFGSVFESCVPDIDKIDLVAMRLNAMYAGAKPEEIASAWRKCDYFSRMSSRAAVDFAPAFLHISGRTEKKVLEGDWPPPARTLENLAETEHLRWCAFHRMFGYRRMTEAEFEDRAASYRQECANKGKSDLRIAKNADTRTHACLITWEELDGLSARENAITGEKKDYKQYDRDNVIMLPEILRALQDKG